MDRDFEARRVFPGSPLTLNRVLEALRENSVVFLPTDTIYGLSCRWSSEDARGRIQSLKGPDRSSSFIALVSSLSMALRFAEAPASEGRDILKSNWPGPFSAVLRARPGLVPSFCLGPGDTLALRCPADHFLQELILALGEPIVSTSANRTGEQPARSAEGAWRVFGPAIDLYLDAGRLEGAPSTLVDLSGPHPVVLRAGNRKPSVRPTPGGPAREESPEGDSA